MEERKPGEPVRTNSVSLPKENRLLCGDIREMGGWKRKEEWGERNLKSGEWERLVERNKGGEGNGKPKWKGGGARRSYLKQKGPELGQKSVTRGKIEVNQATPKLLLILAA